LTADQLDLPVPTAEAIAEFGDSLAKAQHYVELLATDGVTRGLIGPRETLRLWDRHLMNCALVADLVPERGELVDIGSGAGLPGIVLAMLRPSLHVVLLEPLLRRSVFLQECVSALDLPNATVVRARAEEKAVIFRGSDPPYPPEHVRSKGKDIGHAAGISADVATARAVAPLDRLVGWAAGLLRPGGQLLAIKGQSAEAELEAAAPVLSRLGVQSAEVLQAGHGRVISATTIVRVVMGGHGREERAGAQRSRRGMA
jgi:16S rRNA (guanine527-N7)-methyltransferase